MVAGADGRRLSRGKEPRLGCPPVYLQSLVPRCTFALLFRLPLPSSINDWQSEAFNQGGTKMPESVYKVIELVGTSTDSWEKAAAAAVARAAESLRDLRVAEISQLDLQLKDGKVQAYRAKVKVSFKYEGGQ